MSFIQDSSSGRSDGTDPEITNGQYSQPQWKHGDPKATSFDTWMLGGSNGVRVPWGTVNEQTGQEQTHGHFQLNSQVNLDITDPYVVFQTSLVYADGDHVTANGGTAKVYRDITGQRDKYEYSYDVSTLSGVIGTKDTSEERKLTPTVHDHYYYVEVVLHFTYGGDRQSLKWQSRRWWNRDDAYLEFPAWDYMDKNS